MHSKLFRWLSIIGLLAVVALDSAAQAPTPAAAPGTSPATTQTPGRIRAMRVVGEVTFEDIATKVVSPLANGQEITQGTIVRTGASASVVLIFSNGASINLKDTSELNIEQFTQDPFSANYEPSKSTEEPSVSTTSVRLTRGELIGSVKKLKNVGTPGGSKFTVGTPVGAAGIRGTEFRIKYRPSASGVGFDFTITTMVGDVVVELASGTVASTPVSVTADTEIVINNVTVDPTTNTLTMMTSTGTQTPITDPPVAQLADPATIQIVQNSAQQIALAIAEVYFPPAAPSGGTGGGTGGNNNNQPPPGNDDQNGSPGQTEVQIRLSDKAGGG